LHLSRLLERHRRFGKRRCERTRIVKNRNVTPPQSKLEIAESLFNAQLQLPARDLSAGERVVTPQNELMRLNIEYLCRENVGQTLRLGRFNNERFNTD